MSRALTELLWNVGLLSGLDCGLSKWQVTGLACPSHHSKGEILLMTHTPCDLLRASTSLDVPRYLSFGKAH